MLYDVYIKRDNTHQEYFQRRSGMEIPTRVFNGDGPTVEDVSFADTTGTGTAPKTAYKVINLKYNKLIATLKLTGQLYDDLPPNLLLLTHEPNRAQFIILI